MFVVNGEWTEWSSFSTCTKTCGYDGNQQRSRSCTNPRPRYDGEDCDGPDYSERSCPNSPCPGMWWAHNFNYIEQLVAASNRLLVLVDGQWGEWYRVDQCSKACNKGVQTFERVCWPQPQHGGKECEGPDQDYRDCFIKNCRKEIISLHTWYEIVYTLNDSVLI